MIKKNESTLCKSYSQMFQSWACVREQVMLHPFEYRLTRRWLANTSCVSWLKEPGNGVGNFGYRPRDLEVARDGFNGATFCCGSFTMSAT